jgi:signal transduction histidine kinase
LWFPTVKGVAIIDADGFGVNTQPPPVVIEDFILGNKPVSFRDTIQVGPGQAEFEIQYTGLSFITPEHVMFRYKLEGLDKDWVDAGTRRTAFYRYVPPGNYTFRVIAANRDGVWNLQGASLSIVVNPPFWRTWWFTAFIAALLAAFAVVAYKLRVAQLKRVQAKQEAFSRQLIESQENDRKRIAAELHDSLGQSLAIIKNRALVGKIAAAGDELTSEQFDQISDQSTQAIDEVKEIAYNLRPYLLDRLGLTKAIQSMLNKVSASSGIRFSAEIDEIDCLFSKEGEINLYRIVQESINNIVKHAGASAAQVTITRDDHQVNIRIKDNGKGFTIRVGDQPKRGFGLIGITERARLLGGKPLIESVPGQGTTITMRLTLENGAKEIKE